MRFWGSFWAFWVPRWDFGTPNEVLGPLTGLLGLLLGFSGPLSGFLGLPTRFQGSFGRFWVCVGCFRLPSPHFWAPFRVFPPPPGVLVSLWGLSPPAPSLSPPDGAPQAGRGSWPTSRCRSGPRRRRCPTWRGGPRRTGRCWRAAAASGSCWPGSCAAACCPGPPAEGEPGGIWGKIGRNRGRARGGGEPRPTPPQRPRWRRRLTAKRAGSAGGVACRKGAWPEGGARLSRLSPAAANQRAARPPVAMATARPCPLPLPPSSRLPAPSPWQPRSLPLPAGPLP